MAFSMVGLFARGRELVDYSRACFADDLVLMALVVSGLLNKQVGGELGISEITVKAHRGKVMQKMKADSLPDLVKMAGRLGLAWSKA
jgi:DNA-binding CsgD family transcriptional regulator